MTYFAKYKSPVGTLWIAEREGYITHVTFNELRYSLQGEEKKTDLISNAIAQLKLYFEGDLKEFDLPLKPCGTDFQKAVWNSVIEIPYGKTCSYQEIAIKIGNPKGARAVGGANNKNPIMIVIPCHRVIGSNGSLTGYSGGLPVKEHLLNLEKSNSGI